MERDFTERPGAAAEEAVAAFLMARGFVLLARNVRLGKLELDLVMRLGRTVVVVEVRSRGPGSWCTPFGSIDGAKRQRLRHAGERLWRKRFRDDPSVDHLRFDAAAATHQPDGTWLIEHVPAAF